MNMYGWLCRKLYFGPFTRFFLLRYFGLPDLFELYGYHTIIQWVSSNETTDHLKWVGGGVGRRSPDNLKGLTKRLILLKCIVIGGSHWGHIYNALRELFFSRYCTNLYLTLIRDLLLNIWIWQKDRGLNECLSPNSGNGESQSRSKNVSKSKICILKRLFYICVGGADGCEVNSWWVLLSWKKNIYRKPYFLAVVGIGSTPRNPPPPIKKGTVAWDCFLTNSSFLGWKIRKSTYFFLGQWLPTLGRQIVQTIGMENHTWGFKVEIQNYFILIISFQFFGFKKNIH